METPANEGGIGGKFRRRPFRRAPSTPYDRPPTALRGVRGGGLVAEEGGWISKLVDPASRFVANGASKLFSSMFRKRLTAPPTNPEEDRQSQEDVSLTACRIPSSEIQNGDKDGDNQPNNSDSNGIAEIELLLKQKTFTRVEFDRLAELLRSRTVETLKAEYENNNERKEKIPKDEAASPAELAKAYMGSRPSKAASTVGSFRNQVLPEDANSPTVPSTSKRLDLSVAPRSVIRFSGIPEHPENGYQTARPRGRSAIYRMSRSPYFKVNPMTNIQVAELSRDGYSSPSSSQWTPSAMKSGGRQVLKRRSSALDGDFGSFGPIRRIRQKSNLMSPSKEARLPLSGDFPSSPSTPLFKDVSKGSTSVQKPLLLDERKNDSTGLQPMENGISSVMLPPQSSETAQKLLQQLDKLLPSPKERSPELKTIATDEPPSKLTLDMLHGSALRSMEDIHSSNFFIMQGSGNLDTASASHLPNIGSSHSKKLDMVKENGPSKSFGLGVKLVSEGNGVSDALIPSKDAKPGVRSENIAIASSVALPVPKKPAFQMSAPEYSLELDDDDYDTRDLSSPLTAAKDDADTKMSKQINVISQTSISENPSTTSPQSMPVSSSISFRKAENKAPIQPVVTEKNNGFALPIASESYSQSQPPPTPAISTPLPDRPDIRKEQTSLVFSFGSKDANSSTFASTTITVNDAVNDSAGIKVEGSGSEPTGTSATTTLAEGSTFSKSEIAKAGDIFKPVGNTVSSGISTLSTPAIFAFGTSAAPSPSNGSLHSSSHTFPVLGTAAGTLSEGSVSLISINSTATKSSSSNLYVSSASATISTVPSFQFGSGISTTAPVSVSQPSDKSNSVILEATSVKASPFGIASSTAQGTSAVFPSTRSSVSSDVATSVTIFNSGGSSAAHSTSIMSSGMNSSSSALSSLFSNTAGSSSSVALSSAFPSTGSGIFGFSASIQSTGSSPSFANSSQNSTAAIFGTTGGSTSSSPFANNASQNSTANTFSATGGSIFGTQSTQPESRTSQITQSSTSQFGSFSSSPSFGLGNSSSSSFSTSPFAPATSDANTFTSSSVFSFSSGVGSSSANSSSSFSPAATNSLFGSCSQASTSSFSASSSSSNTSQSTGFTFGSSASGSSSSPFTFGSSSGSVFSFTSTGTTASSTSSSPAPVFGMPSPTIGFGSSSPGNDQMNEDNMTDDTNQAATSLVPTFGQPANPQPTAGFVFGSPAVPGSVHFQFGSHQNPSLPQNSSPFQSAGNVEFGGGSFSLGSGGGDKSSRKIVRVKRDKPRRK